MSRLPFRTARTVASCPAVAGFRPASAALAVAAAFSLHGAALAQPVPSTTPGKPFHVHGSATVGTSGNLTTVTTTNGAGNYNALNWQSFSIPGGTTTHFAQQNAASTSINRVVTNNPSSILGSLTSNGRLVLVNQAGIAVGAGASINTAGFTASTMDMTDIDLANGRLRFGGPGGKLTVEGKIVSTSGDVVLIAPVIETGASALIESQGATILAAGQKVELTGRGLEGIVMEVQAGNEALNLGTIKGDAVGVFAGTLRHSGDITATAVSAEGGRVVLKASGDAVVGGTVTATKGNKGGDIDVLGNRVSLLAGAALLANGEAGGGNIRVGGDYQGKNAAVPNASRTTIERGARIEANATVNGNGGRVIVWSDDFTQMQGRIAARGGAAGGNGGFVEVSGKKSLLYSGLTDTRAPNGKTGTLLLDPEFIEIVDGGLEESTASRITDADLSLNLETTSVTLTATNPSAAPGGGSIALQAGALVQWAAANSLTLDAEGGITMDGEIDASNANSGLNLHAGNGDIIGAGPIRVGRLLATANGATSGSHTGGAILLTGNNRVGLIAGRATGVGAAFVFNNVGPHTAPLPEQDPAPLVIGTIGETYGIYVGDLGGEDGRLYVTNQGSLRVDPGASVSGGKVRLEAAGAESDLQIDRTSVYANNGRMDLIAGRDVLIGTETDSETSVSVQLEAWGPLEISAGRHIRMGTNDAEANPAEVSIGSYGGGVTMTTTGGDIDFGLDTEVEARDGPIMVIAKGSILGRGEFSTSGADSAEDTSGNVTLIAETGSASFGSIRTNPSFGPFGGSVKVEAKQGITGETIDASAFGFGSSPSLGAGSGGTVFLHTTTGDIRMGQVVSNGYSYGSSSGSGAGGAGGKVFVTADTGSINFTYGISASGGDGRGTDGHGGTGGEVKLTAGDDVVMPRVYAAGGWAGTGTGSGGDGGKVTISAGRNVTLFAGEGFSIVADGGEAAPGSLGAGGAGGTVGVTAGDDVVAKANAEQTYPPATSNTSRGSGISAIGGTGAPGGKGGAVTVVAGRNIDIASIEVDGGASTSATQAGGKGGDVVVNYGGTFNMSAIFASGGFGRNTIGAHAGQGGAGGTIKIKRTTAGDLILPGSLRLEANGGEGGTATAGEGSELWLGGAGGLGGDIFIEAPEGVVRLQSPVIEALGGLGGENSAGGGTGANGGLGSLNTAQGTTVQVEGNFALNARWFNAADVFVGGGSSVTGVGAFYNSGLVDLTGNAFLTPTGGVFNEAGGSMRVHGSGTAAEVDLRTNAGTLEIGSGATMRAQSFDANLAGGTIIVDGTLDIHGAPCTSCQLSAATPSGSWEFVNQGTVAGNGTVVVDEGAGIFRNASGGVLAPGRIGQVGELTLQAQLVMDAGSLYKVDIGAGNVADLLRVNSAVSGGALEVTSLSDASYSAGTMFEILRAGTLDRTTLPAVDETNFLVMPSSDRLSLVALRTVPTPAPVPAPQAAPPAQPGEVQQVQNEVVTFANLFIQESERQALEERRRNQVGKDDIVITDTACTP